jgi:2-methylcitrate dehydratase PrpD
MTVAEQLAAIILRPVDAETRVRAARHVLDWIGCAALGATSETGQRFTRYGRSQGAGPCATIAAGKRRAEAAAFVNGALGNIFEIDDLHRTSIVHPGDVVMPAVLAAAQRDKADGATLLDAIVRGYEAAIRVGAAAGRSHYAMWYNTATCGLFGAATAVASIKGLDQEGHATALTLAGGQAAGPWQCRVGINDAKQLNTARAAQSGLIAADLAGGGVVGPSHMLEGHHGFFAAMAHGGDAEHVVADSDAPWAIADVSFKPWSACRHTHPVIEAALSLRGGDDIDRIVINTYAEALTFCDKPRPRTTHDARFSLQYCAATTLLRGAPTLDHFTEAAFDDPAARALADKVEVHADKQMSADFPERYSARMDIIDAAGATRSADIAAAKGDPENPLTAKEIEAKARLVLAAAGLPKKAIGDIVTACAKLPAAKSVDAVLAPFVRKS